MQVISSKEPLVITFTLHLPPVLQIVNEIRFELRGGSSREHPGLHLCDTGIALSHEIGRL